MCIRDSTEAVRQGCGLRFHHRGPGAGVLPDQERGLRGPSGPDPDVYKRQLHLGIPELGGLAFVHMVHFQHRTVRQGVAAAQLRDERFSDNLVFQLLKQFFVCLLYTSEKQTGNSSSRKV